MVEYIFLSFFLLLGIFLSLFLLFLTFWFGSRENYLEKLSTYECGFEPFEDTRGAFDVHFYLTAILFIIFDLELTYLFPWLLAYWTTELFGSYLFFMILLALGLIYELQTEALDWA